MKEYVVGLLFNPEKNKVVLIEKINPEWQRGKLNGVGGKVEPNELPAHAMIREFKEETGADVTDWQKFLVLQGLDWIVHCYRSFGDPDIKSMEEEQVNWYSIERLAYTITISNLKWILPLALDNEVIITTAIY